MNVYTLSEARQKLAAVLEEAQRKGAVRIKRRDGSEFKIAPVRPKVSPLEDGLRSPLGSRLAARFARVGLTEDIPELRGQPVSPAAFES